MHFLYVCLGGAVGSGARYLVSLGMTRLAGDAFPYGTLVVNILGSLLLGLLMEIFLVHKGFHPELKLALTTGLLGGFTTYSTFNYEALRLFNTSSIGMGSLYIGLTGVVCLAGGALGMAAGRLLA